MVKNISMFLVLASLVAWNCYTQEITSTETLLETMKQNNDGKWFKNFTFKQLTISYDQSGKITDSTIWYESVGYPLNFRIDRNIDSKDYVIYRNDSTYTFKNDQLIEATNNPSTHLLIKGGLYFMPLEEVMEKLKKYGYKIATFRKDDFNGTSVYVVGNDDMQFWLHAKQFYCIRRIYKTKNGKKVDVVYDDFKRLKGGWVEQTVTFYVDGKLRLKEFYRDIKYRDHFNAKTYDPNLKYEWYLNY